MIPPRIYIIYYLISFKNASKLSMLVKEARERKKRKLTNPRFTICFQHINFISFTWNFTVCSYQRLFVVRARERYTGRKSGRTDAVLDLYISIKFFELNLLGCCDVKVRTSLNLGASVTVPLYLTFTLVLSSLILLAELPWLQCFSTTYKFKF